MRTFRKTALLTGSAAAAVLALYPTADRAEAQTLPLPGQYNWTGFYAGVHGGGVWTDNDSDVDYPDCGPFTNLLDSEGNFLADSADELGCFDALVDTDESPNNGGVFPTFELDDDYVAYTGHDEDDNDFNGLFGGHIGYNWQSGRFVFGLEADGSGVFGDGNRREVTFDYFDSLDPPDDDDDDDDDLPELFNYDGSGTVTRETEIDWLSTFRGRLGAAFGPSGNFLLYGTGGLAVAGISTSTSANFDREPTSDCGGCEFEDDDEDEDDVEFGFTVGAGGEVGLTNNLRFGVEYLYTHIDVDEDDDDGGVTFNGSGGRSFDVEVDGGGIEDLHTFRARLTYAFSPPLP